MAKSPVPPALNLIAAKGSTEADISQHLSPSSLSPRSSRSARSNPGSPLLQENFEHTLGQNITDKAGKGSTGNNGSISPKITAIPQYPPSPPRASPKHGRDASRSFFSNLVASKSSHRLQSLDQTAVEAADADRANGRGRTSSKERGVYSSKGRGSTSDLLKNVKAPETQRDQSSDRKMSGSDTYTQPLEGGASPNVAAKKSKARFGILNRTRSIKADDQPQPKPSAPKRLDLSSPTANPNRDPQFSEPMKTAPLRNDHRERAFGNPVGSAHRNRSADRPQLPRERSQENFPPRNNRPGGSLANSNSLKEGASTHLLSNLHQTGRGAADRLGKAGKGFLGRITRSGSNHERELVTDDNYICSSINLPLVKQTRRTRIAKRLELSKDKTEFWMPALPWRCIDYLNMNGCEEEGLYRIPGSGKDVKHWQRRFDTEHDINLFDEPELYDINTIGSMFKAWLRDLPDEIFPKHVQIKIAEQCMGATTTPQLLKDELSKLPPFNYYLLFAITCHLSLLHSFADKNKMDYRNLCICFQPCLRIDGFCFQFLVQDWKNCWQGCWTEKEYLEEEYRVQAEGEDAESQAASYDPDERAVSSSGSSQHHPAILPQSQQQQQKQPQQQPQQQQKAPNLLRKEQQNNPRPAPRAPAITKSSDNGSSVGNRTHSSSVSTEDQKSSTSTSTTTTTTTTTTITSDSDTVRVRVESKLPSLNPMSPIKL